jgi:GDP-L-fucose synthase
MEYYNTNMLITGSNGFIGSHLKKYLQSKYCNYNLFTPSSKDLDLANESKVDNYILSNKIDIIIHLANRGGGRDTLDMKNITEYNLRIFFNIVKIDVELKDDLKDLLSDISRYVNGQNIVLGDKSCL